MLAEANTEACSSVALGCRPLEAQPVREGNGAVERSTCDAKCFLRGDGSCSDSGTHAFFTAVVHEDDALSVRIDDSGVLVYDTHVVCDEHSSGFIGAS